MNRRITEYALRKRLLTWTVLITFLFTALLGRLAYIQLVQGEALQSLALDQWTRDVPVTAERGTIYDVNGVALARTATSYTVYVRPNAVTDFALTSEVLANTLGLDYEVIHNKISSTKVSEITIKKQVSKEEALMIKSSEATGIYISEDISRYYPYGDFLTQVLGFVNVDGEGQAGIESYYNQYLTGTDGYQLTETDLIGRELDDTAVSYIPSVSGLDVNLTIDYVIQASAETAVKDAMLTYGAKSASMIVMNADTGEIAAMAQSPSFDLNDVPRNNMDLLLSASRNILVTNVFEPGSIFKIITAAAAVEENLFSSSKRFYCPGYKMVDGQRIKCWKSIGHGSQTFAEGVANSCNVVFMETALALGTERMYDYMERLGALGKTGIDVSGEAKAITIDEEAVKNVDLARIGFGQAVAVSGIEMLSVLAAIINGGYLITPHLLNSVTDSSGDIVYRNYNLKGEQVLKTSTSNTMRELLTGVVTKGSGKKAGVAGYTIGGKTGTAQKYDSNGNIAQGKYISSFMGYLCLEGVNYVAMMVVDEPQGWLYYGSLVAAPYVGDVFKSIIAYKNAVPHYTDEELSNMYKTFVMPDLTGMTVSKAAATLAKYGMSYETVGEGGTVTAQVPAAGSYCTKSNVAVIKMSN